MLLLIGLDSCLGLLLLVILPITLVDFLETSFPLQILIKHIFVQFVRRDKGAGEIATYIAGKG